MVISIMNQLLSTGLLQTLSHDLVNHKIGHGIKEIPEMERAYM